MQNKTKHMNISYSRYSLLALTIFDSLYGLSLMPGERAFYSRETTLEARNNLAICILTYMGATYFVKTTECPRWLKNSVKIGGGICLYLAFSNYLHRLDLLAGWANEESSHLRIYSKSYDD